MKGAQSAITGNPWKVSSYVVQVDIAAARVTRGLVCHGMIR